MAARVGDKHKLASPEIAQTMNGRTGTLSHAVAENEKEPKSQRMDLNITGKMVRMGIRDSTPLPFQFASLKMVIWPGQRLERNTAFNNAGRGMSGMLGAAVFNIFNKHCQRRGV